MLLQVEERPILPAEPPLRLFCFCPFSPPFGGASQDTSSPPPEYSPAQQAFICVDPAGGACSSPGYPPNQSHRPPHPSLGPSSRDSPIEGRFWFYPALVFYILPPPGGPRRKRFGVFWIFSLSTCGRRRLAAFFRFTRWFRGPPDALFLFLLFGAVDPVNRVPRTQLDHSQVYPGWAGTTPSGGVLRRFPRAFLFLRFTAGWIIPSGGWIPWAHVPWSPIHIQPATAGGAPAAPSPGVRREADRGPTPGTYFVGGKSRESRTGDWPTWQAEPGILPPGLDTQRPASRASAAESPSRSDR